ncbi:MAG: rod shape-determining protein MreD [Betaproteobacteria bacterium]|nr:rod shape-determining protein MreD [Betaproteobacteria bacterium]
MSLIKPLLLQGHALELPVRPGWVRLSLLLAVLVTWLPWPEAMAWWLPDFLLLTLLYWTWRAPLQAGIGTAFLLGLLTDVEHGALLGGYALSYSLAAYAVLRMRVRLGGFDWRGRAAHLAPVFLGTPALALLIGELSDLHPDPWFLASGLTAAALWPGLAWILDGTGRVSSHAAALRSGAPLP